MYGYLNRFILDRFSEDIDLDGKSRDIGDIIDSFCKSNSFSYRIAIDTDTVKRYMVNYANSAKPLKIETSFRRREISDSEINRINGICVYTIDMLCMMKTNAYTGRDKIRDLYDLTFICNSYIDQLSPQTVAFARTAIEYKGIEQFDYITKTQQDELIDIEKLAGDFLAMYDRLGLFYNEQTKQQLTQASASQYQQHTDQPSGDGSPAAPTQKPSFKDIANKAMQQADQHNMSISQQMNRSSNKPDLGNR